MEMALDPKICRKAEKVFAAVGLDLQTALEVFLRRSIVCKGLPFPVTAVPPEEEPLPDRSGIKNKETREAFEETDRIMRDVRAGRRKGQDVNTFLRELYREAGV